MQIPKPSARQPSLKERANWFSNLIREPGWELLKRTFKPEIRSRITDSDAKEAFLYEAIRAQVIQEIFSTPPLGHHPGGTGMGSGDARG